MNLALVMGMDANTERLIASWPGQRRGQSALARKLLTMKDSAHFLRARSATPEGIAVLARTRALGLKVVPCWALPMALRRLKQPPLALFVRGSTGWLRSASIGFVGARRASTPSLAWVFDAARSATQSGLVVISGGALGIDSMAHQGALDGEGRTVAVLGTPAGRIYPSVNRILFSHILSRGGALVSEHPPGGSTYKSDRVLRNRLIAGLSLGLVVAEAGQRSGSLHTACETFRLGRQIVVAPREVRGNREGLERLVGKGAYEDGQWQRAVSPIVNRSERV